MSTYVANAPSGTGLTTIGAANTVLSSNGTTVTWAPVSTLISSDIGVATGTSLSLIASVPSVIAGFTTGALPANVETISYSPTLNRFVAAGRDNSPLFQAIATSTDGITWTTRTFPNPGAIYLTNRWIPELGLFHIGGVASSVGIAATSPDGITWVHLSLKV